MKKLIYITIPVMLALVMTGCQKYVDIRTQGNLVPGETENYRYLLNDNFMFESSFQLPDIAADDIELTDSAQVAALKSSSYYLYFVNTYTWQPRIYTEVGQTDADWDRLYKTIYHTNVIIAEAPTSTGGTDSARNELVAEARVHRAYAYLMLVNMYGKPYNATTSAGDPGVPLLTVPTLDERLTRASVATVYQQILTDLTAAVPHLPRTAALNFMPSKAAAYATLARTHQYMSHHAAAGNYADSALQLQSGLNDLAALTQSTYPRKLVDPEIIYSKTTASSNAYMPDAFRLSDSLLNLLGTQDLRYTMFTANADIFFSTLYTGRYFFKERIGNFETRNVGPSVPEMILIKAESLARGGDAAGAMEQVNKLRRKRFTAATYAPLTATTAAEALVMVIKERQREFFCRGLRWFDMRRLKNEAAFSRTVTRRFGKETHSLEPNSNRYVFPISDFYINLNPGITPNP